MLFEGAAVLFSNAFAGGSCSQIPLPDNLQTLTLIIRGGAWVLFQAPLAKKQSERTQIHDSERNQGQKGKTILFLIRMTAALLNS